MDKLIKGQTLFEVIIAVGMAAVILVGAISLSTLSVRNSKFASDDSLATKHAQAGIEFLRAERDAGWSEFRNKVGTRCISEPPAWGGGGMCSIGGTFMRSAVLELVSQDEIDATVIVQWTDSQGDHSVRSATTFTRWK